MLLDVELNPNCGASGQLVFSELEEAPRVIKGILVTTRTGDALCDAAAVMPRGTFGPAFARKINDSNDGTAVLIYGGEWGIRFKRKTDSAKAWDLLDPTQWGEPYKIYGVAEEIYFE